MRRVPFRLGATSYVVEDDLVGNARYLVDRVQDMQLVLFDLPDGPSNLPAPAEVAALAEIGAARRLGYTIHLILDLDPLPAPAGMTPALAKAHDVVGRTQALQPWAYVGHLDARALRQAGFPPQAMAAWQAGIRHSLGQVAAWTGGPERLAVENLEGYPPEFVTPVVEAAGTGRCVDVGHLWLDGHDPLPSLVRAGRRLRVMHLHGVNAAAEVRRDHAALDCADPAALDAVVSHLVASGFAGVVTLEVFGTADFEASLAALEESVARCLR